MLFTRLTRYVAKGETSLIQSRINIWCVRPTSRLKKWMKTSLTRKVIDKVDKECYWRWDIFDTVLYKYLACTTNKPAKKVNENVIDKKVYWQGWQRVILKVRHLWYSAVIQNCHWVVVIVRIPSWIKLMFEYNSYSIGPCAKNIQKQWHTKNLNMNVQWTRFPNL